MHIATQQGLGDQGCMHALLRKMRKNALPLKMAHAAGHSCILEACGSSQCAEKVQDMWYMSTLKIITAIIILICVI